MAASDLRLTGQVRSTLKAAYQCARTWSRAEVTRVLRLVPGEQRAIVDRLAEDGVAQLDSGLSVDQLTSLRDEVERLLQSHPNYVRNYEGSDERIYGADRLSLPIREMLWSPRIRGLLHAYDPSAVADGFSLVARISHRPGNSGSGGGWHRDSYAGVQVKALMYLTDTTMENGPFEYLIGSHRTSDKVRRAWQAHRDARKYSDCRFDDGSFDEAFEREPARRSFVAKAGTVLLANTTGIHRGRPLVQGMRMAVTSYYYPVVDAALVRKFNLPPRSIDL